jgi:hypothetical protein
MIGVGVRIVFNFRMKMKGATALTFIVFINSSLDTSTSRRDQLFTPDKSNG